MELQAILKELGHLATGLRSQASIWLTSLDLEAK